MKKALAILITLVFVFSLSACNNNDVAVNNNNSENIVDSLQGGKSPTENLKFEDSQPEISKPSETKKDTKAQTTTSTQEEVKVGIAGTEQNKPSEKTETKDTTAQTTTPNNKNITREKAIEIALAHANLKEANVYDIDAEIDREKNGTVWEVDFETKEYEYSYELDIKTGNITKNRKEPQDNDKDRVEQQKTKEEAAQPTKVIITRDRAVEIALSHAGIKSADVRELDAELDKEKNGSIWEVDFETKEHEYSYNINAVTEEIITSEKERN